MPDPYRLPPELNIYAVAEMRVALLAWVDERTKAKEALELSAEDVAEVDGAGMQLLMALGNMHLPWKITASSNAFADACRLLGLQAWLPANAA